MATRPLTNAEIAVLEPITVEPEPLAVGRLRAAGSWARGAFVLDAAMLLAAALAAEVGARGAGIVDTAPVWLVVYAALVLLLLRLRGLYSWHVRLQTLDDVRAVVTATGLAAMGLLTLRLILPGDVDNLAGQSIRIWAFSAVYLSAGRIALDWAQVKARRQGETAKPTLIVGAGRVGLLTARRLLDHPEFGLQPIGFLDKEPLDGQDGGPVLPVLGASWDLDRVVEEHGVQQVIVTFSTAPDEVLLRLFRRCEELGVSVAFVPRLFEKVTGRLTVDYLGGLPVIAARAPHPRGIQFAIKYAVDRLLATVLLLLASPLMIAAALGVLFTLGRPIFFRQRRVGRDGREFEMLKFRSMRPVSWDGDEEQLHLPPDTAPGGVEGADRRTALGSFLRRT